MHDCCSLMSSRTLWATMVLPTPTSPISSRCWLSLTYTLETICVLSVSMVGTKILKKGVSAGGR